MLRARFPAVYGTWPGLLAATEGPHGNPVDDHRVGVELAGPLEQPQKVGVEAVPDAGFFAVPKAAVGGAAGAAEFRRDVLATGSGRQDEPNHLDGSTVPNSGPAPLGLTGDFGGRW